MAKQETTLNYDEHDVHPSNYLLTNPTTPPSSLTNQSSYDLKKGGSVNISLPTRLIRAVYNNNFAEIDQLLNTQPDMVNIAEPINGYTPLMLAAENPNDQISYLVCKRLIEAGALIKVMTKRGHTPFGQACSFGNLKAAQYMAAVDQSLIDEILPVPPIVVAAEKGHLKVVQWLVESGAYINAQCVKASMGNKGITCLHQASCKGHLDIVQFLVERYNFPIEDCSNKLSCTSLYLAIEQNQLAIAEYLLQRGANPNTPRSDGVSGLAIASFKGYTDMVQLIIKYNANPNQQTLSGLTALDYAIKQGHQSIVQLLLPITKSNNTNTTNYTTTTTTTTPLKSNNNNNNNNDTIFAKPAPKIPSSMIMNNHKI
ncbi:ankyrin 2,3/unc44 [Cavenderia fasciculata]|uniref:Ankyrin 2,3/unc44 n=1 Tax=Cavenderia fasciculata TaxID=261658 RepID=F4QBV6_CACFS|nr:ankyrin 2,3/unc44 [Cavenderia fasciculata]EGG14694.1 ankyrin 2,3/unc44 [Cavenderia fasciculata]|eukprot:XP_004351202.1 ankyrin 2,3/unc44 [Cavenderia fasciculata]